MTERRGILALADEPLVARVVAAGGKPFHARSLSRWVLQRGIDRFERATDLPKPLIASLDTEFVPLESTLAEEKRAPDGTHKLLLKLRDGETVETVWMPQREGAATVCISTQVGCPMACRFCASGLAGVVRNLEAHEIVEQLVHARRVGPVGRIVVMGIGEPTLNLEATLAALSRATSPEGLGISARKITISTVGIPDRIRELAKCDRPYTLALSLHAPDDALRHDLIPTARKWTIADLMEATREYFNASGREVTYEYALLGGVNDRESHALALVRLLQGERGCVNLIPYNSVRDTEFRRPTEADVYAFRDTLRRHGVPATVRWSKGLAADAACGQLRIRHQAS
ncbi:MAG: 23S rRNA (adenine(2503)-C(2))-methyltransferase RlmN [Planctomycetes bacterium]|nr:23S rRNA (adenine(2503)-C(2))-methyltransferase RlmN [Planctomycetota bacterium]